MGFFVPLSLLLGQNLRRCNESVGKARIFADFVQRSLKGYLLLISDEQRQKLTSKILYQPPNRSELVRNRTMMIDYKIRTSTRSRHVRLSVSHHSGVVVVVPRGFDTSRIQEIIVKKEEWIKRSIEKVRSMAPAMEIPTQIDLQSIGRSFSVAIEQNVSRRSHLVEEDNLLRLRVDPRSKRIPVTLLKKWFHQKSADILLPWLERVSKERGFVYNRGAIRSQRTRWGSCSTKKNINLNRSLLFLRPDLVEYLIIHELCHTVEMNHSQRFWELVGRHCQDYRALDKELKSAKKYVEGWLH